MITAFLMGNKVYMMAKKKKKLKDKKSGLNDYVYELIGIAIFVLMLLMLGRLGLIGLFLRRQTVVMFGDLYWLFGLIMTTFSAQMIVKRKKPSLISKRYLGVYMVFTGVTIFAHTEVWRAFITYRLNFTAGIGYFYLQGDVLAVDAHVGGGVFGAFIWLVFADLVTWPGLWLIAVIFITYGILLMTGLTIKDLYDKRKKGAFKEAFGKIYRFMKAHLIQNSDSAKSNANKSAKAKKAKVVKVVPKKALMDEIAEEEVPSFTITDFADNLADQMQQKQPISNDENYILPPMTLLIDHKTKTDNSKLMEEAKKEALLLEETFKDFDVRARVSEVHIGPTVTRYEVTPEPGVKVNKITSLIDDIALALAAPGVRMEAPIPGKSAMGIEIPNKESLLIALGRDISGKSKYAALNKMPHLLVAGATGSGKSVCINTMICSLLMRFSTSEVRLLLVDPKKVELARYNGLPHLLAPVVTDPQLASAALKKVVAEMERRYDLFSEAVVRDIESYNGWIKRQQAKRENEDIDLTDSILKKMPFIVVIIDELSDLMMVASREVEDSIMRLTQMARASGIHLVIATQRPSVDVITGVIKSNIPSRIAFGVSSGTDSRTILDSVGAEKLIGRGDMLFLPMGESAPSRIQGAFITDEEVARVVEFIKGQELGETSSDFLEDIEVLSSNSGLPSDDALIRDVLAFAYETQKISASMLQRRFKIGYNRAARIVDDLEVAGLVGESDGSKGRPVLMDEETYRELIS